jgi:hypothetical protein
MSALMCRNQSVVLTKCNRRAAARFERKSRASAFHPIPDIRLRSTPTPTNQRVAD